MSAELIDAVQTARADGQDPAMAAFRLVATRDVLRTAWLLSITLDVTRDELAALFGQVWPQTPQESIDTAIAELGSWPFVRRTDSGLQVALGMASTLARDFAQEEPEEFRAAHEALVQLEELREIRDDPFETWAVRGRVAFYLAAVRPDESVERLGGVFASAPSFDRTAARIWVSSLALRQEPLLHEQVREISFYRGFRAYVMGDRTGARRDFETVIAEPGDDVYRAIALHLLGVILRGIDPDRGITLLREAIQLSRRLGVRDNELMARASLATAHMAQAQEAAQDPVAPVASSDLEAAWQIAREGLQIAEEAPDETLVAGLRLVATVTEWLSLTQNRRNISPVARNALPRLDEALSDVADSSLRRGDYEQFILAGNAAASMFADVDELGAALSRLERVVDSLERLSYPPARFIRLQQTTRRILSRSANIDDSERARDLLERLDELTTRLPFSAEHIVSSGESVAFEA